ncbi:MAG: tripartite tricarboxylate transporter TctB family protein [Deltaproteobacteria bacterium]|nr:tripartite tricarboxylate transporter TctB family protein [Deltaproteobacteria bacterium]
MIKEKNLLPTASPLADALAGVTALVIAAIFAAQLDVLEGMGRTLPELLLAFISLCGLLLLGNGARKYLRKVKVSDGEAVSGRRIAIVAAGSVIYVVIMPWLGFYPASMIFLCGMTLALRDQRASRRQTLRNALTVTASVCLLVWIGFTRLLNVPTPTGVLF